MYHARERRRFALLKTHTHTHTHTQNKCGEEKKQANTAGWWCATNLSVGEAKQKGGFKETAAGLSNGNNTPSRGNTLQSGTQHNSGKKIPRKNPGALTDRQTDRQTDTQSDRTTDKIR